jgi:cytochrome c553
MIVGFLLNIEAERQCIYSMRKLRTYAAQCATCHHAVRALRLRMEETTSRYAGLAANILNMQLLTPVLRCYTGPQTED